MFGRDSLDGLEKLKRLIIVLKFRVNNTIKDMDSIEIVWAICKLIVPLYLLKWYVFYFQSCIATSGYNAVRIYARNYLIKFRHFPNVFLQRKRDFDEPYYQRCRNNCRNNFE